MGKEFTRTFILFLQLFCKPKISSKGKVFKKKKKWKFQPKGSAHNKARKNGQHVGGTLETIISTACLEPREHAEETLSDEAEDTNRGQVPESFAGRVKEFRFLSLG